MRSRALEGLCDPGFLEGEFWSYELAISPRTGGLLDADLAASLSPVLIISWWTCNPLRTFRFLKVLMMKLTSLSSLRLRCNS